MTRWFPGEAEQAPCPFGVAGERTFFRRVRALRGFPRGTGAVCCVTAGPRGIVRRHIHGRGPREIRFVRVAHRLQPRSSFDKEERCAMDTRLPPLALVTGASSGIGFELAKCCVMNGFDVLIA